jgi:hypothetical protein
MLGFFIWLSTLKNFLMGLLDDFGREPISIEIGQLHVGYFVAQVAGVCRPDL